MIRKGKSYNRPKKLYQKARIEEENVLAKQYALKNKREIWKALAKINYYRTRAMTLAKASPEEQETFLGKLRALGFKATSLSDILALQVEDLLRRRLPTIVMARGLAYTAQQARQMVVHKKISVEGSIINIPGYIVPVSQEDKITSSQKLMPRQVAEKSEDSQTDEDSDEVTETVK